MPLEYNLHAIQEYGDRPLDFAIFLATNGFLVIEGVHCDRCEDNSLMSLQYYDRNQDGSCLACKKGHRKSVRCGSFFAGSHLFMFNQFELVISFLSEATASAVAESCEGPEFEVDELQIKKVRTTDNVVIPVQWVMGLLESSTGKVIFIPVPDRTAPILMSKVNTLIPVGSFVFSDELSSYNSVANNFHHHTVHHSADEYERIDVVDGEEINVHINTLKGMNAEVRSRMRHRSRRTRNFFLIIMAKEDDNLQIVRSLILDGEGWKLKRFLEQNSYITGLNGIDQYGNTLLHVVCSSGYLETVKIIAFANPRLIKSQNKFNKTPVNVALYWENEPIIQFLLYLENQNQIESLNRSLTEIDQPEPMEIETTGLRLCHSWPTSGKLGCGAEDQINSTSYENVSHHRLACLKSSYMEYARSLTGKLLMLTTEEKDQFFELIQREIFLKFFMFYRNEQLPVSLFNGFLYNAVLSFWTETSYFKSKRSFVGINSIVGQLLSLSMHIILCYHFVSVESLGYNVYEPSFPATTLGDLPTIKDYYEFFFAQIFRYIHPTNLFTCGFDQTLTSLIDSIFPIWMEEKELSELKRIDIASIIRREMQNSLQHNRVQSKIIENDEILSVKYELMSLMLNDNLDETQYLQELRKIFPELQWYQFIIDFTPDEVGQPSKQQPNRSLVAALYGDAIANEMQRNLVTEVNKLLIRLLYLRDFIRGDKRRFPNLTQENFDKVKGFLLPFIHLDTHLYFLLSCLIFDDLGRTKPIREAVHQYEGTDSPYDHDEYLKRFLTHYQQTSLGREHLPSFHLLEPFYQRNYLNQISNTFNLGAFVQGESVPISLFQFYRSCSSPAERRCRLIIQIFAFSSFVYSHHFDSILLNDIHCRNYMLASNLILEKDLPESSQLPSYSTAVFAAYLTERAVAVNMNVANISEEERFALHRIIALARVDTNEKLKKIFVVWNLLPGPTKELLVKYLNHTGFTEETAIYIYYSPAIIANTVSALKNSLNSYPGPKELDPFVVGVYYGLQELLQIYEQTSAAIKEGTVRVEEKTVEFAGVYIKHAVNEADKMKQLTFGLLTNSLTAFPHLIPFPDLNK